LLALRHFKVFINFYFDFKKEYYLKIKNAVDAGLLKTNDFLQIFDIPNRVIKFNATIFSQLESKQKKWCISPSNETICDVIYNNCSEVKLYEEFIENSCEIFKCLERLSQSPSIRKFVEELNEKVS
jgi:hypothetical protein